MEVCVWDHDKNLVQGEHSGYKEWLKCINKIVFLTNILYFTLTNFVKNATNKVI